MDGQTQPEGAPDGVIVRRSGQGWQVGAEQAADLTSAMVLADLLAADLGAPRRPAARGPAGGRRGPRRARPPGWP